MSTYKDEWKINETEFKCPICNTIKKNKNSITAHYRYCSGNTVSPLIKWNSENTVWNKGLTSLTDERIQRGVDKYKQNFKDGKFISALAGKKLSDDTKKKISASRRKYLQENPDDNFYNKYYKSSYAEEYFKSIFEKENIPLIHHFRVGTYELDFSNIQKGINLEIDGHQHYSDQRIIESDKKRTLFLESLGWKIIRIKWSEFQKKSSEEKMEIIQSIKNILLNNDDIQNVEKLLKTPNIISRELELEKKRLSREKRMAEVENRKHIILNSNIDFSKFGWISKVGRLLGVSHTSVIRFMKKHMSDFYYTIQ